MTFEFCSDHYRVAGTGLALPCTQLYINNWAQEMNQLLSDIGKHTEQICDPWEKRIFHKQDDSHIYFNCLPRTLCNHSTGCWRPCRSQTSSGAREAALESGLRRGRKVRGRSLRWEYCAEGNAESFSIGQRDTGTTYRVNTLKLAWKFSMVLWQLHFLCQLGQANLPSC